MSDAVLFSTPEYAGALPGSFKNLLDWTIGDDVAGSIYEKRVAFINASAAPHGAAEAHDSLRKVLGYVHAALVEDACTAIPVPRAAIKDGLIGDPAIVRPSRVPCGGWSATLSGPDRSTRPVGPDQPNCPATSRPRAGG